MSEQANSGNNNQSDDQVDTVTSLVNGAGYGFVARLLHWLVASLVTSQYILAEMAEEAGHSGSQLLQLALWANHKSVGMTVLMLAVLRLVWRWLNPPPDLPASVTPGQARAAAIAHYLLYGLLFALPLSGWLMSSATAYSVSWFNLFSFPDLVGANEQFAEAMEWIHESLATALFVIALVHILAAVKHYWFDRDGVLQRMSSTRWVLAFVLTATVVVLVFGRVDSTQESSEQQELPEVALPGLDAAELTSPLPVWQIDYSNSELTFTAEQAGAAFEGYFGQWRARMQFDAEKLNQGLFVVDIELTSVETRDDERDTTLQSAQFFDTGQFPTAQFIATGFTRGEEQGVYRADASLMIKGQRVPVPFAFRLQPPNDAASGQSLVLYGSSRLDRLALGIGTGEWADLSWVGQYVDVQTRVVIVE